MGYGNILVAFDGSEASERSLGYARELVEHGLATKLVVLIVTDLSDIEYPAFGVAMVNTEIFSNLSERAKAIEELILLITDPYKEIVEIVKRTGKPQKHIIRAVADFECGLIVMGSRGLGAIRGALGSVSHAVLRDAEVPVFITK